MEILRNTALEVINISIINVNRSKNDASASYLWFITSCAQITLSQNLGLIDEEEASELTVKVTHIYNEEVAVDE